MIVAHCSFAYEWGGEMCKLAFSFHMPLFFVFSGYFAREEPFKFRKEFTHLLIPYIVFSVLRLIEVNLKSILFGKGLDFDSIIGALYGAGFTKHFCGISIPMNSPLWFLLALFLSKMILQIIVFETNLKYRPYVVFAIVGLGYIVGTYFWLPFSLCSAMVAVFFLYAGYLLKVNGCMNTIFNNKFITIFPYLVWMSTISLKPYSMESNTMPYFAINLLLPLIILPAISNICKTMNYVSPRAGCLLSWCGCFSLAILCVHVLESVINPCGIIANYFHIHNVVLTNILVVIRVINTLLICWLCIKYLPMFRKILNIKIQ